MTQNRAIFDKEFEAIVTPDWKLVWEALQKPLGEASDDETEAVQFFYQVVLSRITTGDLKDGRAKRRGATYFEALGVKWAHTMATGLVLMAFYGDLTNVRANLNVPVDLTGSTSEDDESGSANETAGRKRKGSATANEETDSSRKRARMHTAATEVVMTTEHYKWLGRFAKLKAGNSEEVKERLATWDAKFNPACTGRKQNELSVVTPTGHQRRDTTSEMDQEGQDALQQLLRSMGVIAADAPVVVDNNQAHGPTIAV